MQLDCEHETPTSTKITPKQTNKTIGAQQQCNATISLKQFFDMVYEEPKKMLLYGDACRVSTDPIAKASYFFDLIQASVFSRLQVLVEMASG